MTATPSPKGRSGPRVPGVPLTTAIETSPPSQEEWDRIGNAMIPEFRFLTARWIEPWGDHLLGSLDGWCGPLRFLTARDGAGQILGVLPLATQLKARVRFLALAGGFVPLRGYPVVAGAADEVALAFALHVTEQSEHVGIRLGPVADEDPLTSRLTTALQQLGWHFVPLTTEGRQIVQLPGTLGEYLASLSASELKNVRRRERKMQRERRVDVKLFTTETWDDWDAAIRDIAQIEEQSWLPKLGGDLHFPGDANRAFWNAVLTAKRRGLAARVWILYFEDSPVAYDFNIDSGTCRYSLFAHYAEAAKTYRPGFALMLYEVEDAIARGLRTIDLGAGDPGYKGFWGAQRRGSLVDSIAFAPGLRGAVLTRLASALPAVERARAFAGAAAARTTAIVSALTKALELGDV